MMRLFVALPLPSALRRRLTGLQAGLPGVRWVAEDNLHLTLRFLGDLDGGAADDLADALSRVDADAFRFDLDGVGVFGQGDKARVLWARAQPAPELIRLRDKIESLCQRLRLPPDGRKYTPHVTLAYLKNVPAPKLERYVVGHSAFFAPGVTADRFALYSSWSSSQGPIYREEFSVPLAGAVPSDFDDDNPPEEFEA